MIHLEDLFKKVNATTFLEQMNELQPTFTEEKEDNLLFGSYQTEKVLTYFYKFTYKGIEYQIKYGNYKQKSVGYEINHILIILLTKKGKRIYNLNLDLKMIRNDFNIYKKLDKYVQKELTKKEEKSKRDDFLSNFTPYKFKPNEYTFTHEYYHSTVGEIPNSIYKAAIKGVWAVVDGKLSDDLSNPENNKLGYIIDCFGKGNCTLLYIDDCFIPVASTSRKVLSNKFSSPYITVDDLTEADKELFDKTIEKYKETL